MRWELFLSTKFLLAKKKHAFISLISLISLTGIAIGVAALIVVLSVMSGFHNELREKIIGMNAEILIEKEDGIENYSEILDELRNIGGVKSLAIYINTPALVIAENKTSGIIVRGIDADMEKDTTKLKSFIKEGVFEFSAPGEIIIGTELAKRFGVRIGDDIALLSPVNQKTEFFKIIGKFNSGMYDYDANITFLDIDDARKIFNLPDVVGGIEVKIKDKFEITDVKKNIQNILGLDYEVKTWQETNKNLFSALKLEKITMFIILTLIVVVAALNIASSLIMTVMEKTKDIGILRALGATKKSIMAVFAIDGTLIGVFGTSAGVALGIGLAKILGKYQFVQIPKDIYYIDKIPVRIVPSDIVTIAVSSVLITFFATIYPAIKASDLNIQDALRYE